MNPTINKFFLILTLPTIVILSLLFYFFPSISDIDKFKYEPQGGQFSVVFPGHSESLPSNVTGEIVSNIYRSQDDELTFLASYWNVPIKTKTKEEKIQLIDSVQTKIMERYPISIFSKDFTLNGESARYIKSKSSADTGIKAQIILRRNGQFIMLAVSAGKYNKLDESTVSKYFNTLAIK